MNDLLGVGFLGKTNVSKTDSCFDSYDRAEAELSLCLNEKKTNDSKILKKIEIENGADLNSEDNEDLKEIWGKSYYMLSKLTSEELINLYYKLTETSEVEAASRNLSQIIKSNDSTARSFTDINALFNFRTSQDTSKKRLCCTCKHSNCLKLYCVCLSQNGYCGSDCKCKGCYNKQEFEEIRSKSIQLLEKKRRGFDSENTEIIDGVKVHSSRCHCVNSNCKKNYCQCFRNNMKCTFNCKCSGCAN